MSDVMTQENTDTSAADAAAAAALATSDATGEGDPSTETGDGAVVSTPEDISAARAQGWVEKEKFRGDPTEWIDASTYMKRAREINPIINARNRDLQRERDALREELAQTRKDAAEALAIVRKQATREYETTVASLKQQRTAALSDGDGERVTQIEDEIAKLEKPAEPEKKKPVESDVAPELRNAAEDWGGRNDWYGKDADKTRLTNAVARTLVRERPDLRGSPEFFVELDYQLKADHPAIFKAQTPAALVDDGARKATSATRQSAKKTIADLPKDAQETARRFVKNGYLKDEQSYVDNWFAERAKEA